MYERNAIVLERYFNKIFDFNSESNLRENYYNYRRLFESYGALYDAREKEKICKNEFEDISNEILKIQQTQEKLYNKGAKFEYSRSVIFSNIEENTDNIKKHLEKVADDVRKNCEELQSLSDKFVESVIDYNEKNLRLQEAISEREKAEKEYEKVYAKAKNCFYEISEDILNAAREFINSPDNRDFKKDLQETFENNGKNEKNQFDPDVILNTINKSVDIYKIEVDTYLTGFDRIEKLFEEIETDSFKVDKQTKYYKDSDAKMKFLQAEKEYVIQFLDNERIGAIYDKKTHRKLMLEACKKFALDFEQIEKLYDIILKEIAGRSTKKIYKENYNKAYLIDLENSSIEPSLDTGKMRQDAIAFMNLNYWRISGLRTVYETFEEIITNIYEKDLTEFAPEETKEEIVQKNAEKVDVVSDKAAVVAGIAVGVDEADVVSNKTVAVVEENVEVAEKSVGVAGENSEAVKKDVGAKEEKTKGRKVYHSSKQKLAKAIFYSLQKCEFAENNSEEVKKEAEEENSHDDEKYSVPESVEALLRMALEKEEQEKKVQQVAQDIEVEKEENNEVFDLDKLDAIDVEKNVVSEEIDTDERNIFGKYIDTNGKNTLSEGIDTDKKISFSEVINTNEKNTSNEHVDINEKNVSDEDRDIDDEIGDDIGEDDVDDEEESILDMYMNEEKKEPVEKISKKVGIFQKLVGLNSKKKKEEV